MYHCSFNTVITVFVIRIGNCYRLCTRLDAQAIVGELDSINAVKTSPEKIFLAVVFVIARVDTVYDVDFLTVKKAFCIVIRSGGILRPCHADTTLPELAALSNAIIHHILTIDIVQVGSPCVAPDADMAVRGLRLICKGITDACPIAQIVRFIDRR